jgi:hypothetical protein
MCTYDFCCFNHSQHSNWVGFGINFQSRHPNMSSSVTTPLAFFSWHLLYIFLTHSQCQSISAVRNWCSSGSLQIQDISAVRNWCSSGSLQIQHETRCGVGQPVLIRSFHPRKVAAHYRSWNYSTVFIMTFVLSVPWTARRNSNRARLLTSHINHTHTDAQKTRTPFTYLSPYVHGKQDSRPSQWWQQLQTVNNCQQLSTTVYTRKREVVSESFLWLLFYVV